MNVVGENGLVTTKNLVDVHKLATETSIFPVAGELAEEGLQPARFAISGVLAVESCVVPVIGARTRKQLSVSELVRIGASILAFAIAGTRYDERQMRMLDSGRR
jgi:hypothetical protein